MTQGLWKGYKAKVLQSLGAEGQEEQLQEERENPELVETTDAPALLEEGSNPISQLARRVQGAGARGWRTMSSLFSREDEHQLLSPEPCADHPLAPKAAEPPAAEKTPAGLWDVFAARWQQASALDQRTAPPGPAAQLSGDPPGEEPPYSSDLREPEEGAFKWGFLASKLAEIRSRNAPKSN
ncbi:uncharacterized protein C1orf232 homolog [Pelodiscus sinensis]|uniref:uncharacterized protein C1orf232 homolog n=1 Tax=Pelodiscus sinensis TaxID=13735 RepID=UPI003F6B5E54